MTQVAILADDPKYKEYITDYHLFYGLPILEMNRMKDTIEEIDSGKRSTGNIDWFFREVSYEHMRATFPRKGHGLSIMGPRLVSVQILAEEEYRQKKLRGEINVGRYSYSSEIGEKPYYPP